MPSNRGPGRFISVLENITHASRIAIQHFPVREDIDVDSIPPLVWGTVGLSRDAPALGQTTL